MRKREYLNTAYTDDYDRKLSVSAPPYISAIGAVDGGGGGAVAGVPDSNRAPAGSGVAGDGDGK